MIDSRLKVPAGNAALGILNHLDLVLEYNFMATVEEQRILCVSTSRAI